MEILSSSYITQMVNSYNSAESARRVTPLVTRKNKFSNLSSAYSTLSLKISTLNTQLEKLLKTGTDSPFNSTKVSLSNSDYFNVTSTSSAEPASFDIRVNQLAKNDILLSQRLDEFTVKGITTGTYKFNIKTGDGEGGEFNSEVSVDILDTDDNETILSKINSAVNNDKAVVESNAVTGSYSGTAGEFKIDLAGTEHTITYSAGQTYEEIFDSIISQTSDISGLTAEKVIDGSNVNLKFTVTDSTKDISILQSSDTGTLLTDLGINIENEKGASGSITSSQFSPTSGTTQISFTSKQSGLDYRITNIADSSGDLLANLGLNLGSARTSFDEDTNVGGFLYSDITQSGNQLNAKISFNGVNINRNSNTISDLVNGVTISLKSVMDSADSDVNVNVEKNIDNVKTEIKNFVTNFNEVYTYIKNNSKSIDGNRGFFIGDSNASTIINELTSTVYKTFDNGDSLLNTLTSVGISFNPSSGITLDETTITDKLNNNFDEVTNLFAGETGIAKTLFNKLDSYVGTEGYLTLSKKGYDDYIKSINDRISSVETTINKSAEVLRKKYQDMQMQLATLLASQDVFSNYSSGNFF